MFCSVRWVVEYQEMCGWVFMCFIMWYMGALSTFCDSGEMKKIVVATCHCEVFGQISERPTASIRNSRPHHIWSTLVTNMESSCSELQGQYSNVLLKNNKITTIWLGITPWRGFSHRHHMEKGVKHMQRVYVLTHALILVMKPLLFINRWPRVFHHHPSPWNIFDYNNHYQHSPPHQQSKCGTVNSPPCLVSFQITEIIAVACVIHTCIRTNLQILPQEPYLIKPHIYPWPQRIFIWRSLKSRHCSQSFWLALKHICIRHFGKNKKRKSPKFHAQNSTHFAHHLSQFIHIPSFFLDYFKTNTHIL